MLCKHAIRKTFFASSFLFGSVAALNFSVASATPDLLKNTTTRQVVFVHDTMGTTAPDSFATKPVVAKISLNKNVARFVDAYVKKENDFLQKMQNKSRQYFPTIEKIFQQYDIPAQLKYLAIVESELRSNAKSRVGARGLWQFMPVTAKELGLRITGKTDERLHVSRSTVAAAKYLRYLYAEFGDWLLVLAAYNSGPGVVHKAVKKAGSKNFWTLQKFLPAESRGHVKRFVSIHYFFEGEGSIATQTKAEAKAWQEKLCAEEALADKKEEEINLSSR
jgi:membrane-bound lytic murein transglycosylase D